MQRQVAVAFQGGGARVIGLLAAAHALSELEQSLDLKVRAVSGSSAGTIPAFLLAVNADFDKVKDAIRRLEPSIKSYFPQVKGWNVYLKILQFIINGNPVYNQRKLKRIIEAVIKDAGIDPDTKIADLNTYRSMHLVYSNVYMASLEEAPQSETISDAIFKAVSLPLVFSTYNDLAGGQHADGGLLDNLPTDVLIQNRTDPGPVFAIGFPAEKNNKPASAWEYMYSLASSGIQYRIASAKKAVGQDMVLDLDTQLGTLDFHKIVNIGIEEEYPYLKEQTRSFFKAYLSGSETFKDPFSENKGKAPTLKLMSVEKSIYNFVLDSLTDLKGINSFLNMRVNAYSLINPRDYDEIIIEQLIEFPDWRHVKGLILPIIDGNGYLSGIECHAYRGGPDGQEIKFEQIPIYQGKDSINYIPKNPKAIILLLKEKHSNLIGNSIYLIKKEIRYGFMLPLKDQGQDYLSVRCHYRPTKRVSIALNVPREFPSISSHWFCEGELAGSELLSINIPQNLVPSGFVCHTKALLDVDIGGCLRGHFKIEPSA